MTQYIHSELTLAQLLQKILNKYFTSSYFGYDNYKSYKIKNT